MEVVKILAVDPSLRNTGLEIVSYDTQKPIDDPKSFAVSFCQVLCNPKKYTGTEAILNMLDMMHEESDKEHYQKVDTVLVESPPVMFNKGWSSGTVSSIAHVSGGAVALFGIEKAHLFRPNEWNKTRKKEKTHQNTIEILGNPDNWHYAKRVKSETYMEHILDAASMALWWIRSQYCED